MEESSNLRWWTCPAQQMEVTLDMEEAHMDHTKGRGTGFEGKTPYYQTSENQGTSVRPAEESTV